LKKDLQPGRKWRPCVEILSLVIFNVLSCHGIIHRDLSKHIERAWVR
jgi:hypothetical protein